MIRKVVPYETNFGIVNAILAAFLLFSNNAVNHISSSLALTIIIVAVASGVIVNYKMTTGKLKIIEREGVWSSPASAYLFNCCN